MQSIKAENRLNGSGLQQWYFCTEEAEVKSIDPLQGSHRAHKTPPEPHPTSINIDRS